MPRKRDRSISLRFIHFTIKIRWTDEIANDDIAYIGEGCHQRAPGVAAVEYVPAFNLHIPVKKLLFYSQLMKSPTRSAVGLSHVI